MDHEVNGLFSLQRYRDTEVNVFSEHIWPCLPKGEVRALHTHTPSGISLPLVDSLNWRASDKIKVKQKQQMSGSEAKHYF